MEEEDLRRPRWRRYQEDFNQHLTSNPSKAWGWDSPTPTLTKKRFRYSAAEIDLPTEIRSAIHCRGSHPSEWHPLIRQEELRDLRAGDNLLLYRQTGKGWKALRSLTRSPHSAERVIALHRGKPIRRGQSALSEREKKDHHDTIRQFFFQPTGSYLNTEPTVHISRPADGAAIAWDDDSHTLKCFLDYTFQPGDSLESVTSRLLGYADPGVVYDRNMRNLTDPQPGDRARILVGRDLLVRGSASHTKSVSLSWVGPASDSRGIELTDNGQLDYGDWETRIPAGPGEYELIASVGGLRHKVKFKLIESETSLWARTVGMAKAFANQVVKTQAAMSASWFADQGSFEYRDSVTGEALTPRQVAERFTTEGREILPPQGADEAAGAEIVKALPQTPAIVGVIGALGSEGKSILRHPQHFLDDLKKALTHSRSEAEAMGKAGMEQAHRRLDIEADPRYVDRYHGPDGMGRDSKKNNLLTESEAKGSDGDSVRVSRDMNDYPQGSSKKNSLRAETMTKKVQQGKVGQPSNRQGGPYTEGEMELWREVRARDGNKQHLLVHTNTETGIVRTFSQGNAGEIGKKVDEFKMKNFDEIKNAIQEAFRR